jgi:hypothetical protein
MDTVTACDRMDKEHDRQGREMAGVTLSVGKCLECRQEAGSDIEPTEGEVDVNNTCV